MVQNLENNKGKKKIKVIDRSIATTGIWWVLLQTYISIWRGGVGGVPGWFAITQVAILHRQFLSVSKSVFSYHMVPHLNNLRAVPVATV